MTAIPEPLQAALTGRYRLEREVGQGGMATVYLAQDVKHNRRVAVKVLRPELAAALWTPDGKSLVYQSGDFSHKLVTVRVERLLPTQ